MSALITKQPFVNSTWITTNNTGTLKRLYFNIYYNKVW